jgi:tetratricopeptide (TPR) repeat protein
MKKLLLLLLIVPLVSFGQETDMIVNELMFKAEKKIENNDYSGAIYDLSKAIELKPSSYKAYYLRGYSLGQLNNPNHYKILSDLNKFLNNSKEFSDELKGYVYYLKGVSNTDLGDIKTARNDLKSSIDYYPEFAASYRFRAGINFEHFWDLGYKIHKKFYRAAKSLPVLNQMLGYDIISDCEKSLELEPDNAYAYYIMGRFKERLSLGLSDKSKWNIPRGWGCNDLKQGAILGNENSRQWYEESFCN